MAGKRIIVLCYWGGSTYQGQFGYSYNGEHPKTAIRLKPESKYIDLVNEVYSVMKLDRTEFKLKMTCRFPIVSGSGSLTYVPLEITNDSLVECMFDVVFDNTFISSVELFIKAVPIACHDQVRVILTVEDRGFTPMLSSPPVPFQFGGQQSQVAPQNPSPFQASSSVDFNAGGSFSLGSGGGDKSVRRTVRPSKSKIRKK